MPHEPENAANTTGDDDVPHDSGNPLAGSFGRRATELRGSRSNAELARLSGIEPSALSRVLSGRRRPTFDQVVTIARALGVTLEELISGTDAAELVGGWVPRAELAEVDRLRAEAHAQAADAARELAAVRAENEQLRAQLELLSKSQERALTDAAVREAKVRKALARAEGELASLRADKQRATTEITSLRARAIGAEAHAHDLASRITRMTAEASVTTANWIAAFFSGVSLAFAGGTALGSNTALRPEPPKQRAGTKKLPKRSTRSSR